MRNTLQGIFSWVTSFFRFLEQQVDNAWWVRIQTENPEYTYYFGPFESRAIAQTKLSGFVDDLNDEQAQVSNCTVEWCAPSQVTIRGNHQPARLMSNFSH